MSHVKETSDSSSVHFGHCTIAIGLIRHPVDGDHFSSAARLQVCTSDFGNDGGNRRKNLVRKRRM